MKTVGNILWFILAGWMDWLILVLAGALCYVTVVGIPFGVACFRLASYAFAPFGKDLVDARDLGEERRAMTGFGNFLWILLVGLWLWAYWVWCGITWCISIIGFPFGLAHFKLAEAAFAPLGKRVVPAEMARIIRERKIAAELARKLAASASHGTGVGLPPSPNQSLPTGAPNSADAS